MQKLIAGPALALHQVLRQIPTPERVAEWERNWDAWNRKRLAYVPQAEIERRVSVEEAREQNNLLGTFADRFAVKTFNRMTQTWMSGNDDYQRRKDEGKILLCVGFGKGCGAQFLKEAIECGFTVVWIDISGVACRNAERNLAAQCRTMGIRKKALRPYRIIHAELHTFLADPGHYDIDINDVEGWYFCRLINCLEEQSAISVLSYIGSVSLSSSVNAENKNFVVVINAMCDANPDIVGQKSTMHPKESLINALSEGADRPIEISLEDTHPYFTKKVSALTFTAGREAPSQ